MRSLALIYASITGNTEEVAKGLYKRFMPHFDRVDILKVSEFPQIDITHYSAVVIGTYSWGDGEIPGEMLPLYDAFERQSLKHVVTGVFGTGDSLYPRFCGAVDEFRDMLYVQTSLAVTLKVELAPQANDLGRCEQFVKLLVERVQKESLVHC